MIKIAAPPFYLLLIIVFCFTHPSAYAQQPSSGSATIGGQKDLIDILHAVLKKQHKSDDAVDTVIDRRLRLSLIPAVGYSLQNGFSATVSANGSFYTGVDPSQNLSAINSGISVTQKINLLLFCSLISGRTKTKPTGWAMIVFLFILSQHTALADIQNLPTKRCSSII